MSSVADIIEHKTTVDK